MAWIVPVATAVIGAAGNYLSARKSKSTADKLAAQQKPLTDIQAQTAKGLQPYTTGFYDRAEKAFDPALRYYQSLMSGNRGDLIAALAPEVEGINRGYDQTFRTSSELMPRGGATSSFLAELPYRKAGDVQSLIQRSRPGAAAGLASLAGTAANIGGGAAGYSLNAAIGAGNAMQNQFNTSQIANAQQAAAYSQIAQSLLGTVGYNPNTGWYWGQQPGKG